jgi:hypothetical protein
MVQKRRLSYDINSSYRSIGKPGYNNRGDLAQDVYLLELGLTARLHTFRGAEDAPRSVAYGPHGRFVRRIGLPKYLKFASQMRVNDLAMRRLVIANSALVDFSIG